MEQCHLAAAEQLVAKRNPLKVRYVSETGPQPDVKAKTFAESTYSRIHEEEHVGRSMTCEGYTAVLQIAWTGLLHSLECH